MEVTERLALLGLSGWLAMSVAFKVRHQLEFRAIVVSWGATFAHARLAGVIFPVVEGTLAAACAGAILGAVSAIPVLVAGGLLFSMFGVGQAVLAARHPAKQCGCANSTSQISGASILRSTLCAAALFVLAFIA